MYSTCHMVNRLKIPQGFSTLLFHQWSEVPSRGEFCGDSPYEKLPALQRCHLSQSLVMWFHWCYCFLFSVLFSIALLLLSLHVLPFMFFFLSSFFFHGCDVLFQGHLSSLTAAFSGCFFGLFCPILLGGCLLALRRASISSNWFFIWHSLRPSSTQLLVNNHSGFCSHWYLVGLLFLLSTSFYRLCFSLPPCFSFKWFSSL